MTDDRRQRTETRGQMTYIAAQDSSDRVAKVIYQSKDAKTSKTFDALDWLAQLISFIEDRQIVKKILQHLDLWHVKRKPPARANGPPTESVIIYDECSSPGADDPPEADKLPD